MNWDFIPSTFRHSDIESQRPAQAEPSQPTPTPDQPALHNPLIIARQAIITPEEKVCAFQLCVRQTADLAETPPQTAAQSAHLIVNTLNTLGARTVLGSHLGWINLPDQALHSDIVQLLPCASFVLEAPAQFLQTPEDEARCARLLQQRYALAQPCNSQNNIEASKLARVASHVIYDLALDDLQWIIKYDRAVKPLGLKRMVRNVNTRAAYEACKAFDFDLYQGSFFAKVESLASQQIDPSRLRVMEIFNLVMNKSDIDVIEDAFKHDVALCYSLLCYINSVGTGLQYKVASIRNGIMLLGYDFLWRWLSLLVYAGIDLSAGQHVLLNTAIIRGRLTELLGQTKLSPKEANALFVVGNFSLLDALLGIPMALALQRIHLPEAISKAILTREGKYGPYLELALAFEAHDSNQVENLCQQLQIDPTIATQAHLAAIAWANEVAK